MGAPVSPASAGTVPHGLFADHALLPAGWARNVRFTLGADGLIQAVTVDSQPAPGDERLAGTVVPGMPNVHSHSFQRAMAGLAERCNAKGDSFWTWREIMYAFLERLTPDQVRAISAQLYVEMLTAGYTAVAEFHYLHNDADGHAYLDPATLSWSILEAGAEAGIALTHIPVLYMRGGFDDRPLKGGQRRFAGTPDSMMTLVDTLAPSLKVDQRLGLALHSLRAVGPGPLAETVAGWTARDAAGPIHIHAAEQPLEVTDSLAATGRRPVEWLLENAGVDRRWCFIHATHMTAEEAQGLARSGAVAGLCPTTEGNLGDGFFRLETFLKAGGAFGIGTDSHVTIDPREELRWLDYGQRLLTGQRSFEAGNPHVGARLWQAALAGGAQALGRPCGALAVGAKADLLVLDNDHPSLWCREGDRLLDALVFARQGGNPVRHVMVGGRWAVRDGMHPKAEAIAHRYRAAVAALQADL
ncbi:MAG: formimidoylglutamate deiminase [Azospirillaceae bacterium]|nr:formimidoylglutamate deiminase [Azospirillaceae bacterium]